MASSAHGDGWGEAHTPPEHTRDIPKAVRDAVLARDGYACCRCGAEENLTLHHVIPRGRTFLAGGTHEAGNLVTLCWMPCHSLVEERQVIVKRIGDHWYFGGVPRRRRRP